MGPYGETDRRRKTVIRGTHYEHRFADAEPTDVTVSLGDRDDDGVELRIEGRINGHLGRLWVKRSDLQLALRPEEGNR